MTLEEIRILVDTKLQAAKEKHPNFTRDVIHATCNVAEEAGELSRAANMLTYEPGLGNDWEQVKEEALDTIVVAIRLLENFDNLWTYPR